MTLAILNIVKWPEQILKTPTNKVEVFDDDLKKIVADMQDTLAEAQGIGLAANQVGISKRIIIVHIPYTEDEEKPTPKEEWHDKHYVLINPVITKQNGKIVFQEGCLSVPGIYENITRASEVWVDAQDVNGKPFTIHATGDFAVCIQHEVDHINGMVFVDRMSRLKSMIVRRKLLRNYQSESEETET
jgi:peptide deformylase